MLHAAEACVPHASVWWCADSQKRWNKPEEIRVWVCRCEISHHQPLHPGQPGIG
jgi:hypothetical protein